MDTSATAGEARFRRIFRVVFDYREIERTVRQMARGMVPHFRLLQLLEPENILIKGFAFVNVGYLYSYMKNLVRHGRRSLCPVNLIKI